ncbi:unnamed protein product [Ceratitis capitata]|uniref:(Mediterranean fruit fly) hypothetical protein n=1 Tax=Ceratitis capitata TaxID=7213 RepID=A0A811UDI8_CERCA|nr:unnamed protein product [Ceratitis capitata]
MISASSGTRNTKSDEEMQKRQRVETTTRFQKHLERVRDIVNTAFADYLKYEMMITKSTKSLIWS